MCTQLYRVPPPSWTVADRLIFFLDRLFEILAARGRGRRDVEVAHGLQVPVTLIIIFSNRTRLAY
eukprot:SAG31_NODE_873_length_11325_cov_34.061197_5_plen_65_part_00